MSPEYERWFDVPPKTRRDIKDALKGTNGKNGKKLASLINDGFVFLNGEEEGGVSCLIPCDEAPQGVLDNARKSSGQWHLVRGLNQTPRAVSKRRAMERDWRSETIETSESLGFAGKNYRGKHRSHVKGKGFLAFARDIMRRVRGH